VLSRRCIFAIVVVAASALFAGEGKSASRFALFTGTLSEVTDDKIRVVRSARNSDGGEKLFTLGARTVVEGKLEMNARVTVGYYEEEDGELVASRIIVRHPHHHHPHNHQGAQHHNGGQKPN
jgi:hypothetical protein